MILKGPAIPLYFKLTPVGILVSIGFWVGLLSTATGSRSVGKRRFFYALLGVYILMTFIGFVGEIMLGMIAMSHAF